MDLRQERKDVIASEADMKNLRAMKVRVASSALGDFELAKQDEKEHVAEFEPKRTALKAAEQKIEAELESAQSDLKAKQATEREWEEKVFEMQKEAKANKESSDDAEFAKEMINEMAPGR